MDSPLQVVEVLFFTRGQHFEQHHFVAEVVEDDEIAVEDIEHIGGIVLRHSAVFDRNLLEVTHSIERGVAVETAVIAVISLHAETAEEVTQGMLYAVTRGDRMALSMAIGETEKGVAMVNTY